MTSLYAYTPEIWSPYWRPLFCGRPGLYSLAAPQRARRGRNSVGRLALAALWLLGRP